MKTANQIWDGIMLYGWTKKRFEKELKLQTEALEKEQDELKGKQMIAGKIHEDRFNELQTIKDVLQTLCDKYIANRDTEEEFIVCITPKDIPDYWKEAKRLTDNV